MKNLNEFIEKIDTMKKDNKMDLSSDQDLTFAIMNLISIEEHLYCSGAKTGKNEYYDWILEIREMRKNLLKMIIKEYEGEVWCISKHLLAASMRVMEVGTKQLSRGNKEEAYDLFKKAFDLYSIFWALNLKIISAEDIKKIDENTFKESNQYKYENIDTRITETVTTPNTTTSSTKTTSETKEGKKGFLDSVGDLIKRAINCCLE